MIRLTATAYLLAGLGLSLAANAVMGWQWAQAKAECRADMERAARIAIEAERERAGKADHESTGIATITHARTATEQRRAQENSHARDQAFRAVAGTGACAMPDGLPSLQPAVDEANAAAGV